MKIRKLAFYLLLLLCTTLLLDACNKEMDIPAGYEEAMGQTIYGTADLYIEHVVPMGMGEMTAETTIPLEFPVKIGNRHVDSGEFSIDWEDESEWNFAGAGDFVGVSSIVIVPVTYEVRGFSTTANSRWTSSRSCISRRSNGPRCWRTVRSRSTWGRIMIGPTSIMYSPVNSLPSP
jgi:hypothetical protein